MKQRKLTLPEIKIAMRRLEILAAFSRTELRKQSLALQETENQIAQMRKQIRSAEAKPLRKKSQ